MNTSKAVHLFVSLVLIALVTLKNPHSWAGDITPLMDAANKGDAPQVQSLIAKGQPVNVKGDMGFTPLMVAATRGPSSAPLHGRDHFDGSHVGPILRGSHTTGCTPST